MANSALISDRRALGPRGLRTNSEVRGTILSFEFHGNRVRGPTTQRSTYGSPPPSRLLPPGLVAEGRTTIDAEPRAKEIIKNEKTKQARRLQTDWAC